MNYYTEIKEILINNEIIKRVKDYSKNKSDLESYYKIGKILSEAGKHYGEGIIKEYSRKLTSELGKGYSTTSLKYMRQFFLYQKGQQLADQLNWSHYMEILPLKDKNKIDYYIKLVIIYNLSRNELRKKIKSNEYERLDELTKIKLIKEEKAEVTDFVKNPIVINDSYNYKDISEKILKKLILEDVDNFLKELGNGFCYIENEYKIKIGDRYNYIDMLLFNIEYNCYVVLELKVTELKKEHIGQIQTYMNYIDKNVRKLTHDKTIGIIIVKKDNRLILEYSSDKRIYSTTYTVI